MRTKQMAGKTLYDKLWDMHEVKRRDDGSSLIYIDRHILHEVTSPQAFEGLRLAGRKPWRIDANIATPDHNVPTTRAERQGGLESIADEVSRLQVQTLDENCDDFGILEFKMNDSRQGIVHVVGPEQGATLPGMTVVCGDSHARALIARCIEHEIRIQRALRAILIRLTDIQITPLVEQVRAKAGALDRLQELLGNDLVSVDVGTIQ
jgi:hypothetical protein